ncbi:amidohydrolase family protein [Nakamurella flavida]|uniref:Amidohydrolase family protein n=1 Tax=Nakamurella flavida TaxID=363630 RepID=A0A938YJX8_9ACTN|nr:amidohydrolase family protein [Nakamurella flavida]MBM9475946.1 amidohydrolase family protein [Nakamurella flavida]MBM9478394.1 amidohydrolase family protein [Nakamurella flavida]MDP9777765.1 hypothetical protein [Nakamurella flavida]
MSLLSADLPSADPSADLRAGASAPSAPASPAPVAAGRVDVHQHLWPAELVDALRARTTTPRLDGWTLLLDGEPPYPVDPADHDPVRRRALDPGRVVLGLSSPLGIEDLPPAQAVPLLTAWHDGAAALAPDFLAWASVPHGAPDLDELRRRLDQGFVGLQLAATQLTAPTDVERWAPVLQVCQDADRPVFVHPGPVRRPDGGSAADLPAWWAAVVDYPAQMSAAWWAWQAVGRSLLPTLRIGFAAGAGLAPLQAERFAARGGRGLVVDPSTFVDTASYGRQALDGLTRVLGIDPLVLGSDRPYSGPTDADLGDAATHAVRVDNPRRFLEGTAR